MYAQNTHRNALWSAVPALASVGCTYVAVPYKVLLLLFVCGWRERERETPMSEKIF